MGRTRPAAAAAGLALSIGMVCSAAANAPAGPAEALSWLPADTVTVAGAAGDQVPMLKWLRSALPAMQVRPPACYDTVAASFTDSYQVLQAGVPDKAAVLARGTINRDRVEACIAPALKTTDAAPHLSRDGAITEIDSAFFGRSYLGWTDSWIIWHKDRWRVEQLLSALKKKQRPAPPIAVPLARIDTSTSPTMWWASTVDYANGLLGVPSESMLGRISVEPSGLVIHVTFVFRNPAEANRAAAALTAKGSDPTLPPEVGAAIHDLRPIVSGHDLHFDVDAQVWTKESMLKPLKTLVDEKARALRRKQASPH